MALNKTKNASNHNSEPSTNTKPIKFVEKQTNKLQKQVVKGSGISATTIAVPKYKNTKKSNDFW